MEDPEVEEIPVSASTLIDGSDQTGTGGTSERSGAVRPVKGRKGRVARSSSIDGALNPGNVPPTIRLKLGRPRWFNQSFLVFMALRQAGTPLPRGELIRRALELDKKIGAERGLPPCFTGKTPQNSCSAVLTENRDKYFVSHKPPGAPATIFSLAYQPHDYDEAKRRYKEWTKVLVEKDYPIFFGGTKWYDEVVIQPASDTSKQGKRKAPSRRGYDSVGISPLLSHPELPTPPSLHPSERKFLAPIDESQIPHSGSLPTLCVDFDKWLGNESLLLMRHGESKDFDELAEAQDIQIELNVVVDDENKDADSAIPTSIFDVVEVRESTIANAGRGVFAKRKIPKHTIIGFYFGVPLTEDEFDCMKEKTGQASQYAIRYRFTILDATDESGVPFSPEICPFHYINEDSNRVNTAFKEGVQVNQIYVEATRDIQENEELFVSYGNEIDRSSWQQALANPETTQDTT